MHIELDSCLCRALQAADEAEKATRACKYLDLRVPLVGEELEMVRIEYERLEECLNDTRRTLHFIVRSYVRIAEAGGEIVSQPRT